MNTEASRIGRGASQFVLRMPDGLRDQVKVLAAQNRRSMNAELVLIVERALENANAQKAGAVWAR